MAMTDPIADMLARMRNAQSVGKLEVAMPSSKLKVSIAKVLQEEGYIRDHRVEEDQAGKRTLAIGLKYHAGRPVIEMLQRVSRPGVRRYHGCADLPKVQGGLGVAIVSTSKGLMTDRAARAGGLGGEVLCLVA
jgi:small subunit ribosomal protein S8